MKKKYLTVSEAYKDLFGPLTKYAKTKLYQKDNAQDAAQEAFVRTLRYREKHPDTEISKFILYRETARACRRLNKSSYEIPCENVKLEQKAFPKTGRKEPHIQDDVWETDDE